MENSQNDATEENMNFFIKDGKELLQEGYEHVSIEFDENENDTQNNKNNFKKVSNKSEETANNNISSSPPSKYASYFVDNKINRKNENDLYTSKNKNVKLDEKVNAYGLYETDYNHFDKNFSNTSAHKNNEKKEKYYSKNKISDEINERSDDRKNEKKKLMHYNNAEKKNKGNVLNGEDGQKMREYNKDIFVSEERRKKEETKKKGNLKEEENEEENRDIIVGCKVDESDVFYSSERRDSSLKNALDYLSSFFSTADEKSSTPSSTVHFYDDEEKKGKKSEQRRFSVDSNQFSKNYKLSNSQISLASEDMSLMSSFSLNHSLNKFPTVSFSHNGSSQDTYSHFNSKESNEDDTKYLKNGRNKITEVNNAAEAQQEVEKSAENERTKKEFKNVQTKKNENHNLSSSASSPSIDDVILVVHGIGSSDKSIYSHRDELRESINFIKEHWFWDIDVRIHIELVNWKKVIVDAQNQ